MSGRRWCTACRELLAAPDAELCRLCEGAGPRRGEAARIWNMKKENT